MSHRSKGRKSKSTRHVEVDLDTKYDDELLSDPSKTKTLISKKNARIKQLEHDLEATNNKFNDAQERVEELEDLNEKLESELEIAKTKIDTIDPDKQNTDALDKMDALIDDWKQQAIHYQTKYEEQQEQTQRLRQKYESLNIQFQQQTKRLQSAQAKTKSSVEQTEMHFQQRIETMKQLNSAEVASLRNQLDLIKKQQNESRSKESEDIQASLRELEEQHNTIEKDLQKQIDDTKEMMIQREKTAQQIVDQVNQQFDEYKEMTENQILELKEKLMSYEIDGNIEIILQIDVDGMDATNFEQAWTRSHSVSQVGGQLLNGIVGGVGGGSSVGHPSFSRVSSVVRKPTVGQLGLTGSSISGSSDLDGISNDQNGHRASVIHRPPPKKPAPLLPIHNKNGSQASFNSYHSRQSSVVSDMSGEQNENNNNNNNNSATTPHSTNSNTLNPNDNTINNNNDNNKPDLNKQSSLLIPKSLTNVIQKANPLTLLSAKSMNSIETNSNHSVGSPNGTAMFTNNSSSGSNRSVEFADKVGINGTTSNTDILSRMKSKLLTSFQTLPNMDAASAVSVGSYTTPQSVRASAMNGYDQLAGYKNSPQTPTPATHYQTRNGYPVKKPGSVRSAASAYSGAGGAVNMANGGHSPSGSIISGSDVDRYIAIGKGSSKLQIMMYQQDNAKLAENLKMAHQKNMVMKEQSQRKYKQLQLTLQAERATWNSKTKEYTDKILSLERLKNETELLLKERTMQLQNLETQYEQLKAQVSLQQMEQMHQQSSWQQQASNNNRNLVQQVEHYRVQLSQARNQLLAANNTMRQQNDQINKLKNKLNLEHKTAESLRTQIAQRETTSGEELLEQQVKLLKNQRRMLIHEVRDLREQNERLKNMVVSGGAASVTNESK